MSKEVKRKKIMPRSVKNHNKTYTKNYNRAIPPLSLSLPAAEITEVPDNKFDAFQYEMQQDPEVEFLQQMNESGAHASDVEPIRAASIPGGVEQVDQNAIVDSVHERNDQLKKQEANRQTDAHLQGEKPVAGTPQASAMAPAQLAEANKKASEIDAKNSNLAVKNAAGGPVITGPSAGGTNAPANVGAGALASTNNGPLATPRDASKPMTKEEEEQEIQAMIAKEAEEKGAAVARDDQEIKTRQEAQMFAKESDKKTQFDKK